MDICLPIRHDETTWRQLAIQLTLARRENRVAMLLIAVSSLSLLDFFLTLNQMQTVVHGENSIRRFEEWYCKGHLDFEVCAAID